MLAAMTQDELRDHWRLLVTEADEKLKGSWRGKGADKLIKPIDEKQVPPPHVVRDVQRQLSTTAQNLQYKLLLLDRSINYAGAVLLVTALGTLGLAAHALSGDSLLAVEQARSLMTGIAAGGLGGLLSMAFSLGRADLKAKIPEMRLSKIVTLIRPLLGAVVAIPVAVLVEADYVSMKGLGKPWSTFAFCFVAGFSERWFMSLMDRFESGKK